MEMFPGRLQQLIKSTLHPDVCSFLITFRIGMETTFSATISHFKRTTSAKKEMPTPKKDSTKLFLLFLGKNGRFCSKYCPKRAKIHQITPKRPLKNILEK